MPVSSSAVTAGPPRRALGEQVPDGVRERGHDDEDEARTGTVPSEKQSRGQRPTTRGHKETGYRRTHRHREGMLLMGGRLGRSRVRPPPFRDSRNHLPGTRWQRLPGTRSASCRQDRAPPHSCAQERQEAAHRRIIGGGESGLFAAGRATLSGTASHAIAHDLMTMNHGARRSDLADRGRVPAQPGAGGAPAAGAGAGPRSGWKR